MFCLWAHSVPHASRDDHFQGCEAQPLGKGLVFTPFGGFNSGVVGLEKDALLIVRAGHDSDVQAGVFLTLLAPQSRMWGQITQIIRTLPPKRAWGPKRMRSCGGLALSGKIAHDNSRPEACTCRCMSYEWCWVPCRKYRQMGGWIVLYLVWRIRFFDMSTLRRSMCSIA